MKINNPLMSSGMSLKDFPLVVQYQRGNENASSWTLKIVPNPTQGGAMIVATFNARAAIKDWQPR